MLLDGFAIVHVDYGNVRCPARAGDVGRDRLELGQRTAGEATLAPSLAIARAAAPPIDPPAP
jgi:hypothetical protein